MSTEQLRPPVSGNQGNARTFTSKLPVRSAGAPEPKERSIGWTGELFEPSANTPATVRAESARKFRKGHGLGLGQIVAFNVIGELTFDNVEDGKVSDKVSWPRDTLSHNRLGGQIDNSGRFVGRAQHQSEHGRAG